MGLVPLFFSLTWVLFLLFQSDHRVWFLSVTSESSGFVPLCFSLIMVLFPLCFSLINGFLGSTVFHLIMGFGSSVFQSDHGFWFPLCFSLSKGLVPLWFHLIMVWFLCVSV
uniref:NADH dehydrogenase subunit 4 n=1 Tax=Knipowitschia caucasica TaxID=637954 RepID=A0AAV2JB05_KNICA